LLSGVSFELFNLGPKSTLVVNNFTQVIKPLTADGLETYAMISSFPYPPDFIDWMRQLFANPQPFFDAAIAQALHYGFTGYNVDFEPTVNGTAADAQDYVKFLNEFAKQLHAHKIVLTVCIASWNPIWNWPLLGTTEVDKLMVMSTYATTWSIWENAFNNAVADIPLNKLGIGLECDTKVPLTEKDLDERITKLLAAKVQEIDIWQSPIPEHWWPWIEKFVLE